MAISGACRFQLYDFWSGVNKLIKWGLIFKRIAQLKASNEPRTTENTIMFIVNTQNTSFTYLGSLAVSVRNGSAPATEN